MRFEMLGPLRIVDDAGVARTVAGSQLRVLLAALLLHANQALTVDELTEILWDGTPPAGAAVTIRAHVKRLRRALDTAGERVATCPSGYRIDLAEEELDLTHFQALCCDGHAEARAERWERTHDRLGRALELWRGTPLIDIPSETLRDRELPRLDRLHLDATAVRVDADLHLGRHDQLVPELRDLTERHPLRERFHAQLVLALARGGRQAEALAAYRQARRVLVDELGVEPGPELRRLHEQVLAGTIEPPARVPPAPAAASVVSLDAVPRQLPAAVRHFAGRVHELKVLSELLAPAAEGGGTVVISAIDGMAGVGKTALAVFWAQQHADRFPDGQLYANLRGFDPSGTPLEAVAVARGFLDALGVSPGRVPANPDAQLALYRSTLADRRVLIVLDNARDADQIRPLLPGAGRSLVLITSRNRMTGLVALEGAVPVTLDVLTHGEARDLLTRRLGAECVEHAEDAVDELIDLCSGLPLALNIAAARATLAPAFAVSDLVDELRDVQRRLDTLTIDSGVADPRAVFSWSYRTLSPAAARAFRLLGTHPGPDVSLAAAASMTGLDDKRTRDVLAELTTAHLLTEHVPGRYTLHDLLRAYAAEQTPDTERREALRRLLDHYVHSVRHATIRVYTPWSPPDSEPAAEGVRPETFAGRDQVIAWYEAERPVLIAATLAAYADGFDGHTWRIAWGAGLFLMRRGYRREWAAMSATALAAARRSGELTGQAYALRWLGETMANRGAYDEAHRHLAEALAIHESLGDCDRQANIHLAIGRAYEAQRWYAEALDHAKRAIELCRETADPDTLAQTLNAAGWYQTLLGRHEQALASCGQALDLAREAGNQRCEAATLDSIAQARRGLGDHAEAVARYRDALRLRRGLGDRLGVVATLDHLGDAYDATGDTAAARDAWRQALAILVELDHPNADAVRAKLA